LPEGDGRRSQVFTSASTAFAGGPRGPFAEFLSILGRKDQESMAVNLSTAKGTASFNSRQDRDLFDILHVIQALDAKGAEAILQARPKLRSERERAVDGVDSGRRPPNPKEDAQERGRALARTRAAEAMAELRGDPQKALAMVKTIPVRR